MGTVNSSVNIAPCQLLHSLSLVMAGGPATMVPMLPFSALVLLQPFPSFALEWSRSAAFGVDVQTIGVKLFLARGSLPSPCLEVDSCLLSLRQSSRDQHCLRLA